jgi:hypothetical protein
MALRITRGLLRLWVALTVEEISVHIAPSISAGIFPTGYPSANDPRSLEIKKNEDFLLRDFRCRYIGRHLGNRSASTSVQWQRELRERAGS